ncbi:MAG TPA: hypothetical protein DEQ40_00410 [Oxalobacteraceae bacterium]|jgi:hypothetical protein|nr:hypothetical protein [Oxalobacteraceae bacterium]
MGFLVFLFVGLLWSPSGGLEAPIIQVEMTRQHCEADRDAFLNAVAASNAAGPQAFHKGYSATPCMMSAGTGDGKRV